MHFTKVLSCKTANWQRRKCVTSVMQLYRGQDVERSLSTREEASMMMRLKSSDED